MRYWGFVREKINERNAREKCLIALSILALIFLIWDFLVYQSIAKEKQALRLQHKAFMADIVKLSAEEKVFTDALSNSPNVIKQKKIRDLRLALESMSESLAAMSIGLVDAERLPEIFQDVAHARHGVELDSLRALGSRRLDVENIEDSLYDNNSKTADKKELIEKFILPSEKGVIASDAPDVASLYKHTIDIKLRGSFFDVLSYLQVLESLPWQLYWENLIYEVDQYPLARVNLKIYALTADRGRWVNSVAD